MDILSGSILYKYNGPVILDNGLRFDVKGYLTDECLHRGSSYTCDVSTAVPSVAPCAALVVTPTPTEEQSQAIRLMIKHYIEDFPDE